MGRYYEEILKENFYLEFKKSNDVDFFGIKGIRINISFW